MYFLNIVVKLITEGIVRRIIDGFLKIIAKEIPKEYRFATTIFKKVTEENTPIKFPNDKPYEFTNILPK